MQVSKNEQNTTTTTTKYEKIRETTTMTKIQHDTIQINNGIDATEHSRLPYRISEIGDCTRVRIILAKECFASHA
eukprot:scaffold3183_cov234-Chaetoceros_neogracile.AAC.1